MLTALVGGDGDDQFPRRVKVGHDLNDLLVLRLLPKVSAPGSAQQRQHDLDRRGGNAIARDTVTVIAGTIAVVVGAIGAGEQGENLPIERVGKGVDVAGRKVKPFRFAPFAVFLPLSNVDL